MKKLIILTIGVITINACGEDFALTFDDLNMEFPNLPIPGDNRLTEEGVLLGRMLFYETKLSRTNEVACASCHDQKSAFSDNNPVSFGVDGLQGNRQAMGLFNLAYSSNGFFWDGRAATLRELAIEPILNALELDETVENVILKLSNEQVYKDQFHAAFGNEEISGERIGLALEQFLTSMVSNNSKYDKFKRGEIELTEGELRGEQLFLNNDCTDCHNGFNFDDDGQRFINNGLDTDEEFTDLGREEVTGLDIHRAKFKVPSLRNIEVTAPYMHDGRIMTLREAVEHYNSQIQESSTLSTQLFRSLDLDSTEVDDLVLFLETLTDEEFLNNPDFSSPF